MNPIPNDIVAIPNNVKIIELDDAVSGTLTSLLFPKVIWCDRCSSSIVNVIFSVLSTYPAGALTSSTVYLPSSKSVNTNGVVVDVNLLISFPA